MKTCRHKIIGLVAVFFLFGSCAKDETPDMSAFLSSEYNFFSAMVENVVAPSNLVAGAPATFSATYIKPSPCYFIVGIKTYQNGFGVNLYVLLDLPYPPQACPDVLVGETSEFQIVFPVSGTYTINYKGTTGNESIDVVVK